MSKFLLSVIAICFATTAACADTILKLDLGSAGTDFALVDGSLSTVDDGTPTAGDQDTSVIFTGFLSGFPDIPIEAASFTLDEVALDGTASVVAGGVVVQPTTGGIFELWDEANELLLSGTFVDGAIVGSMSGSATGSFANLSLGTVTDGALATMLDLESLGLSISFTNVNDGSGFSLADDVLNPFSAEGTANMSAQAVPEPTALCLIALASIALIAVRR